MKNKKVMLFSLILFLFLLNYASAYLTLSPARTEVNFKPGFSTELKFGVGSELPVKRINSFFTNNDKHLVNVNISITKILLEGDRKVFYANLTLPEYIEPGQHIIFMGVEEKPSQEGMISVAIKLQAGVIIFSPYPGEYLEVHSKPESVKVGQKTPISVELINRGKERVKAKAEIEVRDLPGKLIARLDAGETDFIEPEGNATLKARWNSEEMREGKYYAKAIVSYGKDDFENKGEDEEEFRLGDLIVKIMNYTVLGYADSRNRFDINIESMWNDEIEDVYAEATIFSKPGMVIFKTPTYTLKPFESRPLVGFYETFGIKPGEYDARIFMSYDGKNSSINSKINILKKPGFSITISNVILLIIAFLFFLAIVNLIIWFILIRRWKKRGK